jgi:hypothetical protein
LFSSGLFVHTPHLKQNIVGSSWEEIFLSFKWMVSHLYKEWHQYLQDFLDPASKDLFESIRLGTAPKEQWRLSLQQLSVWLARKSGRGVIVLIDEYETPLHNAYKHSFFDEVCPLYSSRVALS